MNVRQLLAYSSTMVATLIAATPVRAQQRERVPTATETQFEIEVETLVRDLMKKQRQSFDLMRALQGLSLSLRSQNLGADQRTQAEGALKQVRLQMVSLESDGVRRSEERRVGKECRL